MFSEVFKSHTKDEADDVFIVEQSVRRHIINEVSEEWGDLGYSRVYF